VTNVEIDAQTRESLVNPFISATSVTLQEMAGTEVFPREVYRADVCKTVTDITAIIGLTFSSTGNLALGFPHDAATAVATRMLAETGVDVDDELIRDCVGEIANVISGQAKALLHGTRFAFTHCTPQVLLGADREVSRDVDCYAIVFGSEVGEFTLQICVRP